VTAKKGCIQRLYQSLYSSAYASLFLLFGMIVPVGVAGLDLQGLFGLRKLPQRRSDVQAVQLHPISNDVFVFFLPRNLTSVRL
jgi:hypothetical protein